MGLFGKAAALAQSTLFKSGNALMTAGLRFSRPETISAFVGAINGKVMRNQSGDRIVVAPRTLRRLAMYDPITGAIIKKFKSRISKMDWTVGPDCQKQIEDLHRLEKLAAGWLSPFKPASWKPAFTSDILDGQMVTDLWKNLKDLDAKDPASRKKARWLFDQAETELQSMNAGPASKAMAFLENINHDNHSPFKYSQERWIDDLCILDAAAGPIIRSRAGGIAECYPIPGDEIIRYMNDDLSTPQPPYRAFRWERNGAHVADFTLEDCLYLVKNPQPNGYGFSPVELAVNIITASLYADTYNIESFKDNMPPAIMDLGPVTDAQRIRFRAEWENELNRGGRHRVMFVNSTQGGQMKLEPIMGHNQRDMEYMKYLKWTLSVKCMCFNMSPQDVGFVEDFHKTTAETQQGISTEGTLDMADFLEHGITDALIKPFFGKDLKFGYVRDQQVMSKDQASVHETYLKNGILSPNEVRQAIGQRPLPDGGDQPYIITRTGVVSTQEIFQNDGALELRAPADEVSGNTQLPTAPEGVVGQPATRGNEAVGKALSFMRGADHQSVTAIRKAVKEAKANRQARLDRFKEGLAVAADRVRHSALSSVRDLRGK